jgi:putative sigma-54 modulation protein
MRVNIQSEFKVSDNLDALIRERLDKLATFYERIERADVFVKRGDGKGPDHKTVEIRLAVPGPDLHAKGNDEVVEKAVTEAADKLRRQLLKMKERMNKH